MAEHGPANGGARRESRRPRAARAVEDPYRAAKGRRQAQGRGFAALAREQAPREADAPRLVGREEGGEGGDVGLERPASSPGSTSSRKASFGEPAGEACPGPSPCPRGRPSPRGGTRASSCIRLPRPRPREPWRAARGSAPRRSLRACPPSWARSGEIHARPVRHADDDDRPRFARARSKAVSSAGRAALSGS